MNYLKKKTELETNALYLLIQSNVERHEEVLENKDDIEDVKEETEEKVPFQDLQEGMYLE